MNTNELIGYIQKIYEIEKSLYMQNCFCKDLQNKRNELNSWVPESTINNVYADDRAIQIRRNADLGSDFKGLVWGFLAGVLACILTIVIKGGFIVLGIVLGFVVFLVVGNIVQKIMEIKEDNVLKTELKNKNENIEKNNEIERKEINRRIGSIDTQIFECKRNLNTTRRILNDFYDKNIVYEKYRNIYAISSICEYLKSGRCDSLTGTNGAYNLYEAELRQGIIINKLDVIISKLDRIEQNQYLLYEAINETNRSVNKLIKTTNNAIGELQNLKDNVEICAYNSKIIAQNEMFQSALMTYATIKQIEDNNYILNP